MIIKTTPPESFRDYFTRSSPNDPPFLLLFKEECLRYKGEVVKQKQGGVNFASPKLFGCEGLRFADIKKSPAIS